MNFTSDHVFGVHPAVMEALQRVNDGTAPSYGADDWTRAAEDRLKEIFDCDLSMFLVATGTAANALALSALVPPYGAILCYCDAHINVDECGAIEFFTGGAKLVGLTEPHGKISAESVENAVSKFVRGEHDPKPSAVSITQASELGTVYSSDEIVAIGDVARQHDLKFHMDGARFANALASLKCHPADITWKAGVDALSFGATKNGVMGCDAVVFFNADAAKDFDRRRMRAGQLMSKSRYLGAQMLTYLNDDLWLKNASHANEMSFLLADRLAQSNRVRLPLKTQANEVFPIMPRALFDDLVSQGAQMHIWPGYGSGTDEPADDEVFVRMVTSYLTMPEQIDALMEAMTRTK